MLWKVVAIKQGDTGTLSVNFLIDAADDKSIRDFLQTQQMIIVSIEHFVDKPVQFGNIQLSLLTKENQTFSVISNLPALEAVKNYLGLGFTVSSFKSLLNPMEESLVQNIIEDAKKSFQKTEEEAQAQKATKTQQMKKIYKNAEQQRLIDIVDQTIADIGKMKESELSGVSQDNINRLDTLDADIRKVKMASNTEKIIQTLEKIFMLMEQIEGEHIQSMKKNETQVILHSDISNLDVKAELDKFKKAQAVHNAGTAKSKNDRYYAFFGKLGIYQKFIKQDFLEKLTSGSKIIRSTQEILSIIVITLLIITGIAYFIDKVTGNTFNESMLIYSVHLGSIALSLAITFSYKSKNIFISIIQVVLAAILYFVISTLIIMNFALH